MPPSNADFGRLEPLAMPRIVPASRVNRVTIWLVSDQSDWRRAMARSRTGGTGRPYPLGVRFDFLDGVLELEDRRIVTVKRVSMAEEYLQDHFPTFPVLPGVLMLESMVHAARRLVGGRRLVLGSVRAFKYARFVPPGWSLVCEVTAEAAQGEPEGFSCRGKSWAVEGDLSGFREAPVASSGRFDLRPLRIGAGAGAGTAATG